MAATFLVGPQPPLSSLENAKSALDKADKTAALRYAKQSYRSAQELMREGWMEMARQNGRPRFFRSYKIADSLLNLASAMAYQAAQQADRRACYLDSLARSEHADLENELLHWREALNGSLVKLKAGSYLSLIDLSLQTSQMLIHREEYEEARLKLAEGRETLVQLSEMLAKYSDDEAQKIKVWRRWIEETLTESSKKKTFAVIVDKSAHRTYLVNAGKLVHTYNCDLGYNSAHNKLFAGDGATPEGRYQITVVKSRGSKFYKALLLNYPNPSDKKRFKENKRKGIISPHARIGGLIEIHGEGGKNKDWTEGCVALTNGDMDHLMQYVKVGTPVTIVRRSDQWP
jgi:L,D-peptidoglycan transpeptidase YkuD (ErfK/YbiS/YcfS/YnhG family)